MSKALVKAKKTLPWLANYQFKKGKSGNPAGSEKGWEYSLRAQMKIALRSRGYAFAIRKFQNLGIDIHDGTHGDLVTATLLYKAESGDLEAIKKIIDLVEQPLSNGLGSGAPEGAGENAIKVTVNVVKTTNIQNNFKGTKE